MAEIDREKVMTWLEICGENRDCSATCPYGDGSGEYEDSRCRENLMADAITLLKEQEPVNPIRIVNDNNFLYDLCGFCGKTLPVSIDYDRARYCPLCGRRVKWDD